MPLHVVLIVVCVAVILLRLCVGVRKVVRLGHKSAKSLRSPHVCWVLRQHLHNLHYAAQKKVRKVSSNSPGMWHLYNFVYPLPT